jgi:hypothetical protein
LRCPRVTSERWRRNVAVVGRDDSVDVVLPRSRAACAALARRIAALPAGTPVVLSAAAPFACRRTRRFADAAGIDVTRDYLAFPSALAPAYLVDDAPQPIRVFVEYALAAPPGVSLPAPVGLGVGLLRSLAPVRLIRLVSAGRVAVGRRE